MQPAAAVLRARPAAEARRAARDVHDRRRRSGLRRARRSCKGEQELALPQEEDDDDDFFLFEKRLRPPLSMSVESV